MTHFYCGVKWVICQCVFIMMWLTAGWCKATRMHAKQHANTKRLSRLTKPNIASSVDGPTATVTFDTVRAACFESTKMKCVQIAFGSTASCWRAQASGGFYAT